MQLLLAVFTDIKGYVLYKLGQIDKAIDYSNRAIEMEPNYANAWYNRAYYKISKGDIEDGLADLRKAIEIGGEEYIQSAKQETEFESVRALLPLLLLLLVTTNVVLTLLPAHIIKRLNILQKTQQPLSIYLYLFHKKKAVD